jgi:hypothetical protein
MIYEAETTGGAAWVLFSGRNADSIVVEADFPLIFCN